MGERKTAIASVLGLTLSLAGSAFAHDLYIMPERFQVQSGQSITIAFHNGDSFPESQSLPNGLVGAALYSAAGLTPLENLHEDGKRVIDSVVLKPAGYVLATVGTQAKLENMQAGDFTNYLKDEELADIIDARANQGESSKAARERYIRYAKSIFFIGQPDDFFKHAVGLPIEFVPQKDPYQMKVGDSLPVLVLFQGHPASGLAVKAARAGRIDNIGRTDSNGIINVPINVIGPIRLHTIKMERFPGFANEADWVSFWATLTLDIR